MNKKILFNCKVTNNNNFDIVVYNNDKDNNDKDFVVYKDKVNDIIIVNDFVDKDNDNDFDVYKDKDIVKVLKGIKDNDNNDIDFDNNDIDFDNIYVNKVIDINVNDIKDIVKDNKDNNDIVVLIDNLKDLNVNKNYVLMSINRFIYQNRYYDLFNYFKYAFAIFNYDNKNIYVIIDKDNVNYVLKNLNNVFCQLKYIKSKLFFINQLDKNNNDFNKAKSLYFDLIKSNSKDLKRINYLKKVGIAKLNNINDLNVKIDKINKSINLSFIKQYIIKTNCYYKDLNDLKDIVYKSFKDNNNDKVIKDKIDNIDKDNVNKDYLYKVNKDNDNDFVVVIDNNDFVDFNVYIDYTYDIFNNVDIDKDIVDNVVNEYNKNIKLTLLDISYDLSNKVNFKNILNDIDFDLNKYNNVLIDLYDIIDKDFKVINYIDYVNKTNDIKKVKEQYNSYDIIISFLNTIKDYLIDFDFDVFDINKDYDLYDFDIFQSPMNKHNSKIKKEQSDFLKVAYNESRNDFEYID